MLAQRKEPSKNEEKRRLLLQALDAFELATQLDPSYGEPDQALGSTYSALGAWEAAVRHHKLAANDNPGSKWALMDYAKTVMAWSSTGDMPPERAREHLTEADHLLQRAETLAPGDPYVLEAKSQFALISGDLRCARRFLTSAIQALPRGCREGMAAKMWRRKKHEIIRNLAATEDASGSERCDSAPPHSRSQVSG